MVVHSIGIRTGIYIGVVLRGGKNGGKRLSIELRGCVLKVRTRR